MHLAFSRPRLLNLGSSCSWFPYFFQVVLLESASRAGARLVIPSLATPIGSVIARVVMSRYDRLIAMMKIDSFLIAAGNARLLFAIC